MANNPLQGELFGLEDRLKNNAENYGFSECALSPFLARTDNNYQAAMYLFYGINDAERIGGNSINKEVYESLNTSEIAAMLIGLAKIKLNGKFYRGKVIEYSDLREKKAGEIIPELIKAGRGYHGTRVMAERGFAGHNKSESSLFQRISYLSAESREGFEEVFRKKMAVSSSKNSRDYDFMDPNTGGKLDSTGAKIYLTHFLSKIKAVYAKHHAGH